MEKLTALMTRGCAKVPESQKDSLLREEEFSVHLDPCKYHLMKNKKVTRPSSGQHNLHKETGSCVNNDIMMFLFPHEPSLII